MVGPDMMTRQRSIAGVLVLLLVSCASIPAAMAQSASSGKSTIRGQIFASDGKTPVEGAVVHAYHLSTEATFASAPTGPKGRYELTNLPYGYFDLAVETVDGLFVANQVANVPPAGRAVLSFTIADFAQAPGADDDSRRSFPGVEPEPSGIANVRQKLTGREFWRSPKGIAIIGGAGGAVLLAIASGGNGSSSGVPSPSTPAETP